jgi:hypothetical protein
MGYSWKLIGCRYNQPNHAARLANYYVWRREIKPQDESKMSSENGNETWEISHLSHRYSGISESSFSFFSLPLRSEFYHRIQLAYLIWTTKVRETETYLTDML